MSQYRTEVFGNCLIPINKIIIPPLTCCKIFFFNYFRFVATAECNSPHEGRQLVHTILPINIETLFNLLFSKSKFLLDFHAMRKSTDLVFGDWITNEDGQKTRTFNVTVQLAASVGPKTSKV